MVDFKNPSLGVIVCKNVKKKMGPWRWDTYALRFADTPLIPGYNMRETEGATCDLGEGTLQARL